MSKNIVTRAHFQEEVLLNTGNRLQQVNERRIVDIDGELEYDEVVGMIEQTDFKPVGGKHPRIMVEWIEGE